ncbi:YdeI/OmpD-associated family protein [Chitinophaga sedimenti]|uniref:YdeI/OmpD-associated family protein n=1 Tax=Chitinophaga sedimenti TaxID=2033606 RepID=UPI00200466B4|nr:YdeI/OmpD-associated family protein [Chitinophaga sedimenti]MCK7556610.1 YdeI/OmpD-associated family protein [Chitinophaga sedimenti]
MAELQEQGRMTPAGLAAFAHRTEAKSRVYSHEQQEPEALKPAYEKRFKANKKAWAYWQTTPPSYKKRLVHWVMGAKQEVTQLSRLEKVMGSANGSEGWFSLLGTRHRYIGSSDCPRRELV